MRLPNNFPTICYHHHPPSYYFFYFYYSHKLLSPPPFSPFPSTKLAAARRTSFTAAAASRRHRRVDFCLHHEQQQQQQKVVVIMGATGSGKSKLSIDLATRFFATEIVNSDKMQVYCGLDITTNKIPMRDRRGVPHHLLGDVRHPDTLAPADFRRLAASAISGIASRHKLPLVVGGSNSFIYALAVKHFDPESDVFRDSDPDPVSTQLRYDCCFIWVDVAMPVLDQYLCKRVDEMLDSGMVDELGDYFGSDPGPSRGGLGKAIGVPEFEAYFRKFGGGSSRGGDGVGGGTKEWKGDDPVRRAVYEEAVRAIKDNTCQLSMRQVGKIERLRRAGWHLQRLDATAAFEAAMAGGATAAIWERQVMEPSVKIVKRFLAERCKGRWQFWPMKWLAGEDD
ncbi:adenylate isopentenyltransferase-like [Diospyros lotus]|uniref:adenylate isopentenyltransferase-like n=1 Tax=Diospyros lotus TaxID=55363 RepID=UPI0022597C06|nr:adenylate isopentenyltransferase-like [Diospyros lotus]